MKNLYNQKNNSSILILRMKILRKIKLKASFKSALKSPHNAFSIQEILTKNNCLVKILNQIKSVMLYNKL